MKLDVSKLSAALYKIIQCIDSNSLWIFNIVIVLIFNNIILIILYFNIFNIVVFI